jgi:hypothetical protein
MGEAAPAGGVTSGWRRQRPASEWQPFLESRAVAQREPLQEGATAESNCLFQRLGRRQAGQMLQASHVHRVVAGGVELNRLATDEEVGRGGLVVLDGPAEVCQGMPQGAARRCIRHLGPEQARQGLARVGTVRLHRQVGDERTRRSGFEGSDRLAVARDEERPQERERRMCHRLRLHTARVEEPSPMDEDNQHTPSMHSLQGE